VNNTVTDVDDTPLQFAAAPDQLRIDADTPAGAYVYTMRIAHRPVSPVDDHVMFSIQDDAHVFAIDDKTGVVIVNILFITNYSPGDITVRRSLLTELSPQRLTIRATRSDMKILHTFEILLIHFTHMSAHLAKTIYTASVDENQPAHTFVLRVDVDNTMNLTFVLGGQDAQYFEIDQLVRLGVHVEGSLCPGQHIHSDQPGS
jgi:hypothetical protein